MTKRWLELIEVHAEKAVLGLAAVCMLAMLYMYLIRTPNKITYGGQELGPSALLDAIKQDADALQRAIRNTSAEPPKVEEFSQRLREQHSEGIFARGEKDSLLDESLRRAASFGRKIEVPGLDEMEQAPGSIALVRPLSPKGLELRTGRSMAVRQELRVVGLEQQAPEVATGEEPRQAEAVAWVTVAGYFDKKAQYDDMIRAGYVPYRAKAYVVGVDVQRQEMLSSGEFSDWQDVGVDKAMPEVELPPLVFDEATGRLTNNDEIRETFATIKEKQQVIMQPPFYVIESGDFWDIPPLEGYEDVEEEGEGEEEVRGRDRQTAGPRAGLRRPGEFGGRPEPGRAPGSSGYSPRGQSAADARREARKEIREQFKEAKKLLGEKLFEEARSLAVKISENRYATRAHKRKAVQLVKAADRALERQRHRESTRREEILPEPIVHPESGVPAIWFHDDTVEAGKTYHYRMRVKLWNRYVGCVRAMQDPQQAEKMVVVGEWSLPSEPITVTPSTHFFLSGSRSTEQTASVDVWKWREGRWFKERFSVSVGDVIGEELKVKVDIVNDEWEQVDFTTDAVVLDLRFDEPVQDRRRGKDGTFGYAERDSTVMVYLDPADGQVKERVLIFDRRDPKRKELEDEVW